MNGRYGRRNDVGLRASGRAGKKLGLIRVEQHAVVVGKFGVAFFDRDARELLTVAERVGSQ